MHSIEKNRYAVSEVVGSVILVFIAVLAFTAINYFIFPLPISSVDSNVDIQGSISGDFIELFHVGGEAVSDYKIYIDGELAFEGSSWDMGSLKKINLSQIPSKKPDIMVVSSTEEGGTEIIFEAEFNNPFVNVKPTQGTPTIFSSLFSNTPSEDIICYKNGPAQDADGDDVTFMYMWYRNDESFADIYYSCNTNATSVVRDYTNPANNASIANVSWTPDGKVGGAYEFSTHDEKFYCALPEIFTDLSSNDFSLTLWMKTEDITENNNCLIEMCNNSENYVQILQYNNRIQAGVIVEGVKYVLQSDPLVSDSWYHISILWDSSLSQIRLIINGIEYSTVGTESLFTAGEEGNFSIGHKTDGSDGWKGSIDEISVYGSLVSEDQLYQDYLCSRLGSSDVSVIVSEETDFDDIWDCIVIPNDGIYDGDSKTITIEIIES